MADKSERKIVGFKRFSDLNESKTERKSKIEEVDPSTDIRPELDSDRPMNPNLPNNSKKIEKPASRKNLMPQDQDSLIEEEEVSEKVKTIGRVAKFPRGVKASKALNFLENVKISKKSIWYIMIEKIQENSNSETLQMVKFNHKEGVDLNKFINELKGYYLKKYSKDNKIVKLIEGIKVDGTDKYSSITNIPLVNVDGRKMISLITEDLIKLLSK